MNKLITYENLRYFTYSNDHLCQKPIRGIVLSFFGLGNCSIYNEDPYEGQFFAERGLLYVVPYNNPWAWMNKQAAYYTDEIIDVLLEKYGLSDSTPIISTGGSMGGQSALVYMHLAKRTPIACVANCPVCDMPFHYTERPDLPRTLYSAFWHEDGSIDEILKAFSPLHLAKQLPKSKYYVFHCDKDMAVNIEKHSQRFVSAMKAAGQDITFHVVPDRSHCDLTDAAKQLFNEYICRSVE